ncbi:sodium-dependent nutrient amino acid transporter 1-like [Belonocnema kinseyi]|uniref:sodium-dependent nutrient amino acid transporter 1-like n=1 Tax=Belonocnema kinseyi TaxID=2817044 RepID=UPI00143D0E91|nr:sodium-dependent nutrient amino acid transporter 1-like [Belonocnema kinseyi]
MQTENINNYNCYDNLSFEHGNLGLGPPPILNPTNFCEVNLKNDNKPEVNKDEATWNNSIEFLMSCVALSVGFGNIWRFPFTAYENGGGAFLIPYVILLVLVGKPFYYLEMIIGQFSGKSSIKVWSISSGFSGVGWAQLCSTVALATYYSSLMALTLFYLIVSFSSELPWAKCKHEWGDHCVDSGSKKDNFNNESNEFFEVEGKRSSAELYFTEVVLKEKESIDDGIGYPNWKLALCLLGSWMSVCLVLSNGMKSSGKASYFLAIFPYVILIALLLRAVTLKNALKGIIFFIKPDWSKLLEPSVWYAAVTQCFFSLSVCFGAIITYSAHNEFRHNIYRDVMIITTLDTITSLIAGCTIFGILGNLAYEMGTDDIKSVVRAGTGLAFVSYPDAIAKFSFVPQLFSVLFFVMMFVLGIGSCVGMTASIINGMREQFPQLKHWQILYPFCLFGFLMGLVYVTPGGQFILNLVDHYGTSFVVFILATFEVIGVVWVYGLENFLDDIEFMLQKQPSIYWRLCWFLITPMMLIIIFLYTVVMMKALTYGSIPYPTSAHIAGSMLLAFGVLQIPFWMLIALIKNRNQSISKMIHSAFAPSPEWGPRTERDRQKWLIFKEEKSKIRKLRGESRIVQILKVLFKIKSK